MIEKVDWELVESFGRGLEDLKAGRVKRVRQLLCGLKPAVPISI